MLSLHDQTVLFCPPVYHLKGARWIVSRNKNKTSVRGCRPCRQQPGADSSSSYVLVRAAAAAVTTATVPPPLQSLPPTLLQLTTYLYLCSALPSSLARSLYSAALPPTSHCQSQRQRYLCVAIDVARCRSNSCARSLARSVRNSSLPGSAAAAAWFKSPPSPPLVLLDAVAPLDAASLPLSLLCLGGRTGRGG